MTKAAAPKAKATTADSKESNGLSWIPAGPTNLESKKKKKRFKYFDHIGS